MPPLLPCAASRRTDPTPPTLNKDTHFDDIKADEHPYWQSRSVHQRMDAAAEMLHTVYLDKGSEMEPEVRRLLKTFYPPAMPVALDP